MLGRRPQKVDCTDGSTASDVAVMMAFSWIHEGAEEWVLGVSGVGGVSAW
jgi:hypothetical protein